MIEAFINSYARRGSEAKGSPPLPYFMPDEHTTISADEVHKVARLSRLELSDEEVERYRAQLSGILRYVDRMRDLDLSDVEPMPHVGDATSRLDPDEPGPTLSTDDLMRLAPDKMHPFVKVPKVLGNEGGS